MQACWLAIPRKVLALATVNGLACWITVHHEWDLLRLLPMLNLTCL